ncbi:Nif3-like dinuclear metal center hexameric protein [Biformimicrobium ophioploci]|uniref:YqfO family protein n=1 Tax=Biformimicrobium ophioploci TaxID=3036711 RepID=A0ABQ6LXQ7_9GAMM|nr:YqfO family protein [Microbulbifer sp. NKW57]GMG86856.1 YqfO family protein [Microbulbifer sp. NKW57]
MLALCVYIPATHLTEVKQALFEAGAGRIGDYDSCCWEVVGRGQFRPRNGATPFIGKVGDIEAVDEYRVEMVLDDQYKDAVVAALRASHPYEEPAFHIWRLES